MTDRKNARKRPLFFWFLPVGLVLLSAILIVLARGIGIATAGDVMRCLLLNDKDDNSTLYDVTAYSQLRLNVSKMLPQQLGMSPDGRHSVFRQSIQEQHLWRDQFFVKSTDGQIVMLPFNIIDVISSPEWSPDGNHLVVGVRIATGSPENGAILLTSAQGFNSQIVTLNAISTFAVGWSPDSLYVFVNIWGGKMIMLRANDLQERHTLPHISVTSEIWPMVWSPNGHHLAYLWESSAQYLSVYDPETDNDRSVVLPVAETAKYVGWSPNSRYLTIGLPHNVNSEHNWHISFYDLFVPGALVAINEVEASQKGALWWTLDSRSYIYVQSSSDALVAYYPQTNVYKTLISGGIRFAQSSPDEQKLLIERKVDKGIVIDILFSPEQPLIRVVDGVDDARLQIWRPDNLALLILVRRGNYYELDLFAINAPKLQLVMQNLSEESYVDVEYSKGNPKQVAFAWRTSSTAGISIFDWSGTLMAVYSLEIGQTTALLSGIIDALSYAPDQSSILVAVQDSPNRAKVELVFSENKRPSDIEHGLEPAKMVVDWTLDSQYIMFRIPNQFVEIINSHGEVIHRWDVSRPQQRINQLGWTDCKP